MLNTTSKIALGAKAKRGFGLIDVSLGIIAGTGLLVGAVILFQQVTTNNAVSELTRNSVSISSEIRSAARNLGSFDELSAGWDATAGTSTDDEIVLTSFGLEPALIQGVEAEADDNQFTLTFTGLTTRACNRAAVSAGNLGANVDAVDNAACATGELSVTFNR